MYFYNSIHPQGPPKKDTISQEGSFLSEQERAAHHKKVRQWFLNPTKYCTEIEGEQRKYPGKCIYHLSKSHPTHDCNIKKEPEKLVTEQKKLPNSSSSSISSDQLWNLKKRSLKMLLLMLVMMFYLIQEVTILMRMSYIILPV